MFITGFSHMYLIYLAGRADNLDRIGTKVWGWKINHPDLLQL